MNYLQTRFPKLDKKYRRNYDIEYSLFQELEAITSEYDATVSDLVNTAISYLIDTEDISIYKKPNNEITVTHTMLVYENNIKGLECLKEKYGIGTYKLVNIAIRNALKEI